MAETTSPADPAVHFETSHLAATLKGRAVRGGAVSLVTQGCKLVLGMGSTMVLARLLTPADFGLVGMVGAVIGFAEGFKDLGLSTATIQRAEINHRQISTVFWLNVLFGLVVSLLVAGMAPLIAMFYHRPQLTPIGLALAGLFVIGGFGIQHQALLRRQMRFVAQAVVEIAAWVVGIAVGISCALAGAGYWSLIAMQFGIVVTTVVGVWIACRWRPGRPVRGSGVRSMVRFGALLTVSDFLNYIGRNLDNVLIGWRWGEYALGFYSKAYQLLLMPIHQINNPIRSVAVPTLSRLQDDPAQYRTYYLKALALIMFVTTPMILLFILLSEEIVLVVLGPQWSGTATIFRLLGVAALAHPLLNTSGWFYVSLGQSRRLLRWTLFSTPVYAAAFAIGLPYGAKGVAACYAIACMLLAWPCMWYATRGSGVGVGDVFAVGARQLMAGLVAVLPCWGLKVWLGDKVSAWLMIVLCIGLSIVVYFWFIVYVLKMKDYYLSVLKHFRPNQAGGSKSP